MKFFKRKTIYKVVETVGKFGLKKVREFTDYWSAKAFLKTVIKKYASLSMYYSRMLFNADICKDNYTIEKVNAT